MGIPLTTAGVTGVSGTVPPLEMMLVSLDSDMFGEIVMPLMLAVKGVRVDKSDRCLEWPPMLLLMLVDGECDEVPADRLVD